MKKKSQLVTLIICDVSKRNQGKLFRCIVDYSLTIEL